MSYNIAVASTDGINIDKHFGTSDSFIIIRINDDGTYEKLGERIVEESQNNNNSNISTNCGEGGCGHSCGGHNDQAIQKKVEAISDCRCVLCFECGQGSERQLGKNNISVFAVSLKLDEALKIIIKYYKRSDGNQSLKNIRE